jgi:predicted MPP superfamily phosphohydrolase
MEPDLLLLTGDYLQALPGRENLDAARRDFKALLRGLAAPRLGIYAVKGDTEGPDWLALFEGTPVVPLSDAAVRLPLPGNTSGHLSLLGISPGMSRGRNGKNLRRLVRELPAGDLKVVFGHSPDFVMALAENTIDLALARHTHGGQIALPFFGPPITRSRLPRKMARGLHFWNGMPLHVSAGVGMERELAPQVRFLCRPEVCLLRVKV